MQRYLLLFLLTTCLGGCVSSGNSTYSDRAQPTVPPAFEFVVVQLNDVYEISPLDGGRTGGNEMGLDKDAGGYFQATGNVVYQNNAYAINGAPIDDHATYEAVLPEFLSLGLEENLDFMDEQASYSEIKGGDANLDVRNLVIKYLQKNDWINNCSFAGIYSF